VLEATTSAVRSPTRIRPPIPSPPFTFKSSTEFPSTFSIYGTTTSAGAEGFFFTLSSCVFSYHHTKSTRVSTIPPGLGFDRCCL